MQHRQWDIFCQVIDNYGDAGVAWRLARQLAVEQGVPVRLWINDLAVLHRLVPSCRSDLATQYCQRVEIRAWPENFPEVMPASVVVEAFGCRLPPAYLHAMSQLASPPIWVNLEYLSAESWVFTHHGLASPHPGLALTKYFFFPGYQRGTGGVLHEQNLMQQRAHFQSSDISAFWQGLGLALPRPDALHISLFAYENAALHALLNSWVKHPQSIVCLVPEGKIVPQLAAWLGEINMRTGTIYRRGHLEFHLLPFLDQDKYDHLLWACDLNFVRGEDSCVRAQWAARSFVWQAYPQQENAHWAKLDALSTLYTEGLPAVAAQAMSRLWAAWNGRGDMDGAWTAFLQNKPDLDDHATRWPKRLAEPGDLATNLLAFVEARQAR